MGVFLIICGCRCKAAHPKGSPATPAGPVEAQDPELGEAKDGGATQVNPLSLHLQTDLAGRTVQRTVRKNSNGGL